MILVEFVNYAYTVIAICISKISQFHILLANHAYKLQFNAYVHDIIC